MTSYQITPTTTINSWYYRVVCDRLYWLDPVIPRLLEESLPLDPTAALGHCEDRLREAFLLLSATRLFNQLYERNTRSVHGGHTSKGKDKNIFSGSFLLNGAALGVCPAGQLGMGWHT